MVLESRRYGPVVIRRVVKRAADFVIAVLCLVLLFPVIAVVALAIRIAMGKPVLFRQERPGLSCKPFTLYKFRTMNEPRDGAGSDGTRLTRLGSILRSTSLDELPGLWNVLRGDMSLVGPRPLLMRYLPRYTDEQRRRHDVKPGMTGWAQVNGRNSLGWEEKFALDVWYVDNWSLWLDFKIMMLTVVGLLRRKDINHPGAATMTEFLGTSQRRPG